MIRTMFVFGTRPEAIKMAPLILEMQKQEDFEPIVCVTGQHREMLDQVLELFKIKPEFDLNLMKPGQTLEGILTGIFTHLPPVLEQTKPDILLVQGDTTSTFCGAKCAFLQRIPVGHVEAGLRTGNKYSPFPEEVNRRLTGVLADLHFAPTATNRNALLAEGYPEDRVFITGNTVIDALLQVAGREYHFDDPNLENIRGRLILVTAHRRESFGQPFRDLCNGLLTIAKSHPQDTVLYPVHLNPNVRKPVMDILSQTDNIRLIEPMEYEPFVHLLKKAYIVLTDSGGIQEESPSLGVPALVMRERTERPEGIDAGTVMLVGTNPERIAAEANRLLDDPAAHKAMSEAKNPYGDGKSAIRHCEIIREYLPLVKPE